MSQNQLLLSDNETAIAPRILHTAGLKMRILSLDYLHLGTQSLAHCDSKQCIGSETMLSQPGQPPESHEQCLLYDCSLLLKDKRKKKRQGNPFLLTLRDSIAAQIFLQSGRSNITSLSESRCTFRRRKQWLVKGKMLSGLP